VQTAAQPRSTHGPMPHGAQRRSQLCVESGPFYTHAAFWAEGPLPRNATRALLSSRALRGETRAMAPAMQPQRPCIVPHAPGARPWSAAVSRAGATTGSAGRRPLCRLRTRSVSPGLVRPGHVAALHASSDSSGSPEDGESDEEAEKKAVLSAPLFFGRRALGALPAAWVLRSTPAAAFVSVRPRLVPNAVRRDWAAVPEALCHSPDPLPGYAHTPEL
jgi:hypothetical protein